MSKSEASVSHGEPATAKLEAPIQLTPDQLETAAGGFLSFLHLAPAAPVPFTRFDTRTIVAGYMPPRSGN